MLPTSNRILMYFSFTLTLLADVSAASDADDILALL